MSTFLHGVASGDPAVDRVVIWTRVEPPATVRWQVTDAASGAVAAAGEERATAERDGCVSVDVDGLRPGTAYEYAFEVAGERSPVGRTRTLPGHGRTRFAFTSCAKFNAGFFNAYDRLADRDDLDFVLHLGDYIYEASNTPPASQTPGADIGRPFDPLHECVTLDDYRTRYRQYAADPSVQRVRAAHPFVTCADDHELADGAWRDGAAEHKPEYGPWSDRKDAAFRAREEWTPIRRPDSGDPTRVHRRIEVGDLADLLVIDTRSRRDEPVAGDARFDPARTALGADQKAWLTESLRGSTASWRLLANPSILSVTWHPHLPDDAELATALLKLKLIDPEGTGQADHDQWDGYPAERIELLELFDEVDDLVVLSGDIHVALAAEVRRDPWDERDERLAVELVTPSVSSQNLDDKLGYPVGGSGAVASRFVACHPHVEWADFDVHGYVLVELDRDALHASWWAVDDVLRPCDGERRIAAAVVRRGGRLQLER